MTTVYRRENGYGTLDTHSPEFQLGRKLFEAQRELSKGDKADPKKLEEIAHWFCELVTNVGLLRADYSSLLQVLKGGAEYEYDEDGLRYRVRRECAGRAGAFSNIKGR
jgi:hypothetical protein